MKTIHIVAILGGAAAFYYYKTKKANVAVDHKAQPAPKVSGGFYLPQLKTSGGLSQPSAPAPVFPHLQLEGYFSTGCAPCPSGTGCC